jgi:hypothetical protein
MVLTLDLVRHIRVVIQSMHLHQVGLCLFLMVGLLTIWWLLAAAAQPWAEAELAAILAVQTRSLLAILV